MVVIIVSE